MVDSLTREGSPAVLGTTGNEHGHLVLRGGTRGPNFSAREIRDALELLRKNNLPPHLMVDCSHANSGKQHAKQEDVWRSVIEQRLAGARSLIGMMVESNLQEGNQPFPRPAHELTYGVSITDACINWETSERMLRWGHEQLGALKG